MGPLVSILTPTYNHGAFIAQAIESVRAQTYTNWEMLVVDDGSTDETLAVARSSDDPRIRVESQPNKGIAGLGETYNAALASANGGLIAILEGDDYWPRDKLARQVPDFESARVVLSSGLTQVVDVNGSPMATTPHPLPSEAAQRNDPLGSATFEMMDPMRLTYTFPVATMLRRTALEAIGGFQQPDYLPLVDYPTFLRLSLEGEFHFHNHVLGLWRRHPRSTTMSNLPVIIEGAYRHVFEFIERHRPSVPLTNEQLDEIERKWDSFEVFRSALRGRLLGSQRMWRAARAAFREGGQYRPGPKSRALLITGGLLVAMHVSPEPAFRMAGKEPLDKAANLKSGDALVGLDDMTRTRRRYSWRAT